MQTFITDKNVRRIARTLDYRRLNKQRIECKQIYTAITEPNYGWQNHPAVNMWRNHKSALAYYGFIMCQEWLARGYKDHKNLYDWFRDRLPLTVSAGCAAYVEWPHWWGNKDIILSHRANLVRKDPEYYQDFWPTIKPRTGYVWPRRTA